MTVELVDAIHRYEAALQAVADAEIPDPGDVMKTSDRETVRRAWDAFHAAETELLGLMRGAMRACPDREERMIPGATEAFLHNGIFYAAARPSFDKDDNHHVVRIKRVH